MHFLSILLLIVLYYVAFGSPFEPFPPYYILPFSDKPFVRETEQHFM